MTPTQKIKIAFLSLIVCNALLSANAALAQVPENPYRGPELDIKRFLCAPSDPTPQNTQIVTTGNDPITGSGQAGQNNPARNDLYLCINKIYRFAIALASAVGVMFIVVAGYLYMSSDGNGEAVEKAKGMLVSTVTSLVILFSGYLLLRTLNPDLIQFQNIQPPSVRIESSRTPVITTDPNGNTIITGGGGGTAADIGQYCTFDSDKQRNEIPNLTKEMYEIAKAICFDAKNAGGSMPRISSVIGLGQHATNSYHYKGCAVDFGDNTTSALGKIIIAKAKEKGLRVNPGTDANKTNHIHIDLGSRCAAAIADPDND